MWRQSLLDHAGHCTFLTASIRARSFHHFMQRIFPLKGKQPSSFLLVRHSKFVPFSVRINVLSESRPSSEQVPYGLLAIFTTAPSRTGRHGLADASRNQLEQSVNPSSSPQFFIDAHPTSIFRDASSAPANFSITTRFSEDWVGIRTFGAGPEPGIHHQCHHGAFCGEFIFFSSPTQTLWSHEVDE